MGLQQQQQQPADLADVVGVVVANASDAMSHRGRHALRLVSRGVRSGHDATCSQLVIRTQRLPPSGAAAAASALASLLQPNGAVAPPLVLSVVGPDQDNEDVDEQTL